MPVKVLLIEDVEDLGISGELVSVKPGYARNYLLPQELGIRPDKHALQMQVRLQEVRRKKAEVDREESVKISQKLEGQILTTIVKVDEEGRMYGSVSAADIRNLIEETYTLVLLKKAVQLKHPIKETGEYTISVRLKENVECTLKLNVEPDVALKRAPKKVSTEEAKEGSEEGTEAPSE